MENCEKCAEMFPKKRKNAQVLLKSQVSAQECWKCKIVLQIRKSAQRNRDRPTPNPSIIVDNNLGIDVHYLFFQLSNRKPTHRKQDSCSSLCGRTF